jgi:hypothetical protein
MLLEEIELDALNTPSILILKHTESREPYTSHFCEGEGGRGEGMSSRLESRNNLHIFLCCVSYIWRFIMFYAHYYFLHLKIIYFVQGNI